MERLFSTYRLASISDNQPKAVREKIEKLSEDYLLDVSEEDLVAALADEVQWEVPILGEPFIFSDREIDISKTDPLWNQTYVAKGSQISFHIPFEGDATFFRIQPPCQQTNVPRAIINQRHLEVIFQGENLNGVRVREEVDQLIANIRFHLDQLSEASNTHNTTIANKIRPFIQARKKRILDRRQMVANIGLPMKKRDGAAATYTVPVVRRRPQIIMPVVKGKAFVPEPALAEQEYETILSIIRNMVSVMERSPDAFRHLKEEDLRWHFLIQLNGQYEGRATGETFNYKGDTDILIREKDRNVFVAECKFWKGKQSLSDTIDQLLDRYVHWRDTKTAILLFNRNKDFSGVLAQVTPVLQAHPCFKRQLPCTGESEWRFVFRNRDDANREIYLAVLAFDVAQNP
jgi:hypothetical protein